MYTYIYIYMPFSLCLCLRAAAHDEHLLVFVASRF